MSFIRLVLGREQAIMTRLLSIFRIVEPRQMRSLFDHLTDKQYGLIMSRLAREGLIYYTPGAKYLAISRFTVEKGLVEESVKAFWAFIKFKDKVLDFCASSPPAIVSFTSGHTDYDLIPLNAKAVKLLNDPAFEDEKLTVRLFVVSSIDELSGVNTRLKNDYAIEVGPNGVVGVYEL